MTVGSQVLVQVAGGFGGPGGFGGQGGPGAAPSAAPSSTQAIAATGITVLDQAAAAAPTPTPASGQQGRGFGGRGGLQGTVTAVDASGLTVQLASGQELQVTTSADTQYYRRSDGAASDVTVGSQVLVQLAGGFGRPGGFGQGGADASQAPGSAPATASDITVLEP